MTANDHVVVREKSTFRREFAVIPPWAFVVAVLIFVCATVFFGVVFWPHKATEAPPVPFQLLLTIVFATLLSFWVLMVGYVNRDAGRRGMSRTLWTLIVVFVPNAIGFILYFILRTPLQIACPQCQTVVNREINYCPTCGHSFHPTCPHCKAPIRPNDVFCGKCGQRVAAEHSPTTGV